MCPVLVGKEVGKLGAEAAEKPQAIFVDDRARPVELDVAGLEDARARLELTEILCRRCERLV